jgi:aminocarboxymuconate-semialdehyde decarboxylase
MPGWLILSGGIFHDSRLWFETYVHDARIFALIMDIVGTERLVLGTNFAGWDQHAICAEDNQSAAFADNARSLLRVND